MAEGGFVEIVGNNNYLDLKGLPNTANNKRMAYLRWDAQGGTGQVPRLYFNDDFVLVYSAENAQGAIELKPDGLSRLWDWPWDNDPENTALLMARINALTPSVDYLNMTPNGNGVFQWEFTNMGGGGGTYTFPTSNTRYLVILDFSMVSFLNEVTFPNPNTQYGIPGVIWAAPTAIGNPAPLPLTNATIPNTAAQTIINHKTLSMASHTSDIMGVIGDYAINVHQEFEIFPLWPSNDSLDNNRLNGTINFTPYLTYYGLVNPAWNNNNTNYNARVTIRIYRTRY